MPDDVEPVADEPVTDEPTTDPPATDPPAKTGHPRLRKVLRRTGIGLVVLLLVLGGGAWWTYRDLEGNLEVIDPLPKEFARAPRVVLEGKTQPLNLLVIGTDTRVGQKGFDENVGGDLSDTTILLHVSAGRNRAYGVSIPRDLIVSRPECPSETGVGTVPAAAAVMFNTAYGVGREGCTILTVEKLTGIRIDDVVVVKFDGLKDVVDAVGGVPVCVPKTVDKYDTYLPAGTYLAKGDRALDYVRARIGVGDGSDIGRMKRQQAFLAAMTKKVLTVGTLANPFKLYDFLSSATSSLIVSEGLSHLTDLARLGRDLRNIGLENVQFLTMPIAPYAPDPNRLAVGPGAADLWDRLRNDRELTEEQVSGATSPDGAAGRPAPGRGTRNIAPKHGELSPDEAARYGLCAPDER